MPFILLLIFGTLFLLICANSKGNSILRMRDFPVCLYQEEYLKYYELLMEYRRDLSRNDPDGDAREDAGQWIYDRGYLPVAVKAFGRADWKQRPLSRRTGFARYEAHERPSYRELLALRLDDQKRRDFLKHYGKDIALDQEKWNNYCSEMDEWFVRITEQYNIRKYQIEQNRPTGYALEYLIACCEMFRPKERCWDKYHVRLAVSRSGLLPTSLKPHGGHEEGVQCDLYVAQYPPQADDVNRLLAIDKEYWEQHGYAGYNQYQEKIVQLYYAAMNNYQEKTALLDGVRVINFRCDTNIPFRQVFNIPSYGSDLELIEQYTYHELGELKW